MSKQKLSKEKRKAKQKQHQRHAREERERQKAALTRDMEYLAELGALNSEKAFSEAAFDALYQSAEWRNEREFANLSFDAFEAGQSANRVWGEKTPPPEKIERMSEEDRDDLEFDLNSQALAPLLAPEWKRKLLERMSRFRQRLRAERKWETLAQAALVEMSLRASDGDKEHDIWTMCMLAYAIFMDALDEYEQQAQAAEVALESTQETIKGATLEEILAAPESHPAVQGLMQAVKSKPGLFDFFRRGAEKMIKEAEFAVWKGEIGLGLFTTAELEQLGSRVVNAMRTAGMDTQSEPGQARQKIAARAAELIYDTAADLLDEMDTPERRAALYATARQRLDELARQKGKAGAYAASLRAVLHEEKAPSENEVFVYAFISEMRPAAQERVEK